MIIQCPHYKTSYTMDEIEIPEKVIRVKCKKYIQGKKVNTDGR